MFLLRIADERKNSKKIHLWLRRIKYYDKILEREGYIMNGSGLINYQGSKANLLDFIKDSISDYVKEGSCILDIFSGSGVVSNAIKNKYKVYANDVELYASMIAKAILQPQYIPEIINLSISELYNDNYKKLYRRIEQYIVLENRYLEAGELNALIKLYKEYPTVWNSRHLGITPENLRTNDEYDLFMYYYAGSYFGISQAIEIDSLVYAIHMMPMEYHAYLFSCLFYAMKETVFAKDGHMAQPLDPNKYPKRLFDKRKRNLVNFFFKKLKEILLEKDVVYSDENKVFNMEFSDLINDVDLMNSVDLIYADPPYTDMQYSRYYHLLNVACKYDYPELTLTKNGYTKGLYTEGRYQSKLSQKSSAKKQILLLMKNCYDKDVNLALSYAYPQDIINQATDRYNISIEELIESAKNIFGSDSVQIKQVLFSHSNNRNSTSKKVIEYLIMCGKQLNIPKVYNIQELKAKINEVKPSNNNPMYNSHLYWSQKAYNICDLLIKNLSEEGEIVFDPFMGSGVTVLEAIKTDTKRIGIGCDVNEMPSFIIQTLLNGLFNDNLNEYLNDFITKIKPIEGLYETICPKCGNHALIINCVFDKPERNKDEVILKVINFECKACKSKGTKQPDIYDYDRMCQLPYKNISISNNILIRNSKIAVGENDHIKDIFTNRNFYALDLIVNTINVYQQPFKDVLRYLLMSVLHLCKITDKHSNSQWPLWIPKKDCVEKNIIRILTKKCESLKGAISFVKDNYYSNSIVGKFCDLQTNKCMILQKGSQYITEKEIPDNSVSLIITDPPYLEQVMYSEYMQLYTPFIGLDYNLDDEIVVSSAPSRNKDKANYFKLLSEVFDMCSKKLRVNRYMCLYFHDSNLDVWSQLISILYKCGFQYVSQVHIKKTVTLKNIISPKKSLNGDSILFFINTGIKTEIMLGRESIEEIELNIIKQAKFLLRQNGAMSTPELYDEGLMEILIQNGWLSKLSSKYDSLVEIFEKHLKWDKDISRWKVIN